MGASVDVVLVGVCIGNHECLDGCLTMIVSFVVYICLNVLFISHISS